MSSLVTRPDLGATSAAGAMRIGACKGLLVGLVFGGLGTSSAAVPAADMWPGTLFAAGKTTSGTPVSVAQPSGAAIGELRRLSGLTWDQLARLFNVSRRSLHFWASGKAMSASNEEHLQRILAAVRRIDQGSAQANRALLLGVREDGSSFFDLLAAGRYQHVVSPVRASKALRHSPAKPTKETLMARAPQPPEALVDALQDPIHRVGGKVRVAKSVRVQGGR